MYNLSVKVHPSLYIKMLLNSKAVLCQKKYSPGDEANYRMSHNYLRTINHDET